MTVDGRIGIIGGGLGGLAAACTLAARGHRVVLFEKNDWLGGKAAVGERGGFRFDQGPTILTLPSVLARVFAEAGRDLHDHLDLVPLDPQWRCIFEDGSVDGMAGGSRLDLVADVDRMADRLGEFTGRPSEGEGYRRFLEQSRRLHEVSERYFFWRSVGSVRDTLQATGLFQPSVVGDVLSLSMGRTVAGTVHSHLSDPRVAQMVDHFTQYVGSSPDASPAVLCGIAHMQTDEGIWYPRGGIGAVPRALSELARELGVEHRAGVEVRRVLTKSGRVSGVELDTGESVPLAAVVSNSDSVRTHAELLDDTRAAWSFRRRRRYEPACSGVVLYLGLRERYDHLLHHNFVFSRDAHEEFEAIYRRGEPAPDPTCYVCAPARTDPDVAPPGGEALYVLVHTPYLRPGQDWSRMLPDYRRVILDKLERVAGMDDIERRIVVEDVMTPADIERRFCVWKGAIYGLASHGRFLGAFKPANRSPDVKGLYLAGGSAHPGPGMPMALMSGWIAADTLDRDGVVTPTASPQVPMLSLG
jgi:phytoene desaturase